MTVREPSPAEASFLAQPRSALGHAWVRLSTGVKIMLILAFALLPLGIIAVLASLESAQQNRDARRAETQVVATTSAAALNTAIARTAVTMRATATALALNPTSASACRQTLESLAGTLGAGSRLALFGARGGLLCATAGFRAQVPDAPGATTDYRVGLDPQDRGVTVTIRGATGSTTAIGLLSRDFLASLVSPHTVSGPAQIVLHSGTRVLQLTGAGGGVPNHVAAAHAPVAGGQLSVDLSIPSVPIRPVELVTMLLPIVMLLAATTIGWLVLDQLLLRPLAQLQRAVLAYQPGSTIAFPMFSTPATEIRGLGLAFEQLTATVARHEAELEEGLARQRRLTREVHHRVKNNLQVVASLINLHARGASNEDTVAAYASIQRRVDALATVHRNHYAEFEQNRGVALRPLVQELAGNLRVSATGRSPAILLAIEPFHVTQDTAVAVAFLLTELVELVLLTDPATTVTIKLTRASEGKAVLAIASPALRPSEKLDAWLLGRFGRVMEGLARQLRTRLERDEAEGSYSVVLTVLD